MSATPENENGESYRVGRFLAPYRGRLVFVFGVMVVNTFLGLLNPWFIQQLIDRVLLARRPDLLWIFGVAIVSVALFRFGSGVLQSYVYTGVTSRILLDMRRDFLAHLQKLSLRFFSRTRFGDIVTRFNRDLSQLQELTTGALLAFLTSCLTLLGTVSWALYYDWQLFLLAAIPFPFALLIARLFRARVQRLTRKLRELATDLASMVIETVTGIRTIRVFGRERGELSRFVGIGHKMIRSILSLQLTNAFASGLPRLCLVGASVIVYTVGGAKVIRGEAQLGELIALGMYVAMIFQPLMSLVDLYLQLVQARVSLDRVREMRELPPDITEDATAVPLEDFKGTLAFEDVRFRYRPDQALLEGLSFAVPAGQTVALVGASGAGKSTIVDLVYRFLDPESGTVRIDGQDVRGLRMRGVRNAMALVSQEDFLFHAPLIENVRYGNPDATREDALNAARMAGLDEVVPVLADGYDTVVGERGAQLSGGQRQRVSIARALLRKPRVLVLDEATSALDYAADRSIREAIRGLMAQATTLIITHRLTSLGEVDRVLLLQEGRIVEEGAPDELLARDSLFKALLAAQGRRGSE